MSEQIKEEWRPIVGFEGLYEVSNKGKVKSLNYSRTKKSRIMKATKYSNGYMVVQLCKNKLKIHKSVHRLVAETFIPNPNNYPQINHKDEDKTNNHVNNLEWCTAKYNSNYGTGKYRCVTNKKKKVYQYDKNGNLVKIWDSGMDAQRCGFFTSNISKCVRGVLKYYKGFQWYR